MQLNNQIAVVTGVSKGIGLELVKLLLDKGTVVAGWGRNKPDLAHQNFHFFTCDVAKEESVENAFQQTTSKLGTDIRILVNNAGFGVAGDTESFSSEDWKAMFDTNVHGIFYTTKRLIPGMKAADEGHILNVASIAGLNGVSSMAGYVGTKHAVRGISHSFYMELRDFGIKVSTIYPGSVQTSFFDEIEGTNANENMMRPVDVATTMVQTLETHPNYFVADVECRPLRPKGKK
ncbi:NADP-dependent 3-hydroxy acid dehydrogenase YdfG [Algoriphagus ratkowskyi]|uniref:NADP-dependent 3-hydroxy acid dehydrogenase YdfG n=1 Tax=Algoriphagus ratkowskyi TaxID=57028 RepID=A0A2W7RMP8_9BACT|nr:SDR family oxidoreductase [Algoriphagus ratkowskyi]PZX60246.1 NADP-dependent 3-hydroxy acid dehydrogenase YdfG [Algoriphagus ratkowskyi]TXD78068.1 SDR family oxidoreductase [Algoriphagus ratkowskyi]